MHSLVKTLFAFALAALAVSAQAFPFEPLGPTASLAVTGTATAVTLPDATITPSTTVIAASGGMRQFLVVAGGTQTVFMRCDGVTPTVSNAMPVLANMAYLISLERNVTSCSAIASATGSTVYFTVGSGQ